MNENLKPCPFCGSSSVKIQDACDEIGGSGKEVVCYYCWCSGPFRFDQEDAVRKWNERYSEGRNYIECWVEEEENASEEETNNSSTGAGVKWDCEYGYRSEPSE